MESIVALARVQRALLGNGISNGSLGTLKRRLGNGQVGMLGRRAGSGRLGRLRRKSGESVTD